MLIWLWEVFFEECFEVLIEEFNLVELVSCDVLIFDMLMICIFVDMIVIVEVVL